MDVHTKTGRHALIAARQASRAERTARMIQARNEDDRLTDLLEDLRSQIEDARAAAVHAVKAAEVVHFPNPFPDMDAEYTTAQTACDLRRPVETVAALTNAGAVDCEDCRATIYWKQMSAALTDAPDRAR